MKQLHNKLIVDDNIALKEGQRGLLCSNNESIRCPSLGYEYIPSSEDRIEKAFDLLFEEVIKMK